MSLRPLHAFLISFAIGFISGFSFLSITLGWLAFIIPNAAQLVLIVDLAVGIVVGAVFGGVGLLIFYLGKSLGRKGLLAIAAGLFVLGVLTIQPEIDLFALVPLAFAFFGVGRHG